VAHGPWAHVISPDLKS